MNFLMFEINLYIACLTKTFHRETKIKKLNCTLPWIESMLNNPYNDTIIRKSPCGNNDSFEETNEVGRTFAKEISKFGSKYDCVCPGNTIQMKYVFQPY